MIVFGAPPPPHARLAPLYDLFKTEATKPILARGASLKWPSLSIRATTDGNYRGRLREAGLCHVNYNDRRTFTVTQERAGDYERILWAFRGEDLLRIITFSYLIKCVIGGLRTK